MTQSSATFNTLLLKNPRKSFTYSTLWKDYSSFLFATEKVHGFTKLKINAKLFWGFFSVEKSRLDSP